MSGETEADVSGWTTDTLREHLSQRVNDVQDGCRRQIADLRIMLDERYDTQTKALDAAFVAAEQAVQVALANAEKAVTKAELSADKRFEAVNEFRAALTDQTAGFVPRTEYDAAYKALTDKFDADAKRTAEALSRVNSRLDLGEGHTGGAADSRTESRLNTGQILQIIVTLVALAGLLIAVLVK